MAHLQDRWKQEPHRQGLGNRWRVRWRTPSGATRSRSFERRADALAFKAEVERDLNLGAYRDPSRGKQTVGANAEVWFASHEIRLKPSTAVGYRHVLDKHVLSRWGDVPLSAVTFADADEWVASLARSGLSAQKVRHAYGLLSQVLDYAVKDRRLAVNPVKGVALPRLPMKRRRRYLDHTEVAGLANAAGPHRATVLLLAYTGLRWGEAVALDVADVDPQRQRIHVERALVSIRGRLELTTPKDGEYRSVPVPSIVLDALDLERDDSSVLLPAPQGGRWHSTSWRRVVWARATRAVGQEQLRTHDLRHTAASLAVSAGANVLAVARMLGHANPNVTLNVYADLFDSDLDDVARRLDDEARRAVSPTRVVSIVR
jgi:integrase